IANGLDSDATPGSADEHARFGFGNYAIQVAEWSRQGKIEVDVSEYEGQGGAIEASMAHEDDVVVLVSHFEQVPNEGDEAPSDVLERLTAANGGSAIP